LYKIYNVSSAIFVNIISVCQKKLIIFISQAPLNDDDSDDENPIAPIDDDGTENFNFDLENLFKNSVISNATRASFMTNIGLDESNLISEPMVISLTFLPTIYQLIL